MPSSSVFAAAAPIQPAWRLVGRRIMASLYPATAWRKAGKFPQPPFSWHAPTAGHHANRCAKARMRACAARRFCAAPARWNAGYSMNLLQYQRGDILPIGKEPARRARLRPQARYVAARPSARRAGGAGEVNGREVDDGSDSHARRGPDKFIYAAGATNTPGWDISARRRRASRYFGALPAGRCFLLLCFRRRAVPA